MRMIICGMKNPNDDSLGMYSLKVQYVKQKRCKSIGYHSTPNN